MSGYSGTPLWKKLGIKPGSRVCVSNAPPGYDAWVSPLPEGVSVVSTADKRSCDIVHLFVNSLAGLDRELGRARLLMRSNGAIWVSWPKKSAKIPTDVDENRIRSLALQGDLVATAETIASEVATPTPL